MNKQYDLVLGTHNRKKGGELAALLAPYNFHLTTLAEFPESLAVEETGTSFAENAALKAGQQARHLERWVMGEDSGLSVDGLDGAPGVFSARYSGATATDESNNRYLLDQLGETPDSQRTAHYTCHIAVADPTGEIRLCCEATCRGKIRREEIGNAGFGYDPLFEIQEYHQTFGQLGDDVKSLLSHRAKAIRQLIPGLLQLARSGNWHNAL
ncbi:MAG: RdgB/HAM1 family non-canonical purine NTP pyrophosphatase [Pirellulales bacterium]|nr:RdgB/HAM1 family non-canonical purine NTP pyrophosphatase [Pirellulales bacterium]